MDPGGFTAEQIVQMMAELRKNKGRKFSKKARLSKYPYRGQSAVVDGSSAYVIATEGATVIETESGIDIETEAA